MRQKRALVIIIGSGDYNVKGLETVIKNRVRNREEKMNPTPDQDLGKIKEEIILNVYLSA